MLGQGWICAWLDVYKVKGVVVGLYSDFFFGKVSRRILKNDMIAGGLGMALVLDLLGGWVCGVWLQDFLYCDTVLPENMYPGSPTTIFYSLVYEP